MNNGKQDKSQGKLARLLLVSYHMRQSSYMVRGLVGAYLVYLMYQLFSESGKSGGTLTLPMIAAGVFMMAAGIYFVIGAAYGMINGIYEENDPAVLEEEQADTAKTNEELADAEAADTEAVHTEAEPK